MTRRLSVNINDECADALRRVKAARGITTTEAIRRAISALDYLERARDTARLHVMPAQVCKACGNYTDTPGHFWGCMEGQA